MTITEHLEFSVVNAPLAQIDRRALSQAWYSALYGDKGALPKSQRARSKDVQQPLRSGEAQAPEKPIKRKTPIVPPNRRAPGSSPLRAGTAEFDRRAARSALARNIERRFLRPGAPVRTATFALQGERGRVQV